MDEIYQTRMITHWPPFTRKQLYWHITLVLLSGLAAGGNWLSPSGMLPPRPDKITWFSSQSVQLQLLETLASNIRPVSATTFQFNHYYTNCPAGVVSTPPYNTSPPHPRPTPTPTPTNPLVSLQGEGRDTWLMTDPAVLWGLSLCRLPPARDVTKCNLAVQA